MTLPVAILAGGRATRLGDLAREIPKSLIEVAGKPFIVHQLDLLRRRGVAEAVICVGHLGEQIEAAVGDGSRYGIRVRYSYDVPGALGTAGALRHALPILGKAFFVLYGDSYLDCDYQAVEQAFVASGRLGLLTIFPNDDRWDLSNVLYVDGQIIRYSKQRRTADMRHIDYGLAALQAAALLPYPEGVALDLTQVYEDLVVRGELAAYEVTERFYEIGAPEGLAETRQHLEQSR